MEYIFSPLSYYRKNMSANDFEDESKMISGCLSSLAVLSNMYTKYVAESLQWHHNGCDGVSNNEPDDCLHNRLFRRRSNKTFKLRATGLCVGNSPVTGEFTAQMASNAENVSIWWRHHDALKIDQRNVWLSMLHW